MKSFLPILSWLPQYGSHQLKGDLSAGLTVGVMLIPQGMAYATLAGLPPIYGLYASTIPLIIYAIFGTSRQLAVGPVAMVAILIVTGVGSIATPGTNEFIALALLLALMVGVIQFLLGLFRLGFLVNFLSHPVISGFTSAAALIIGFSQLKHLLGVDLPRSNFIHEIALEAIKSFDQVSIVTLLLGLGGIALIWGAKKWNKSIPGPLIAVVLGILLVYLGGLQDTGVKIVGQVPQGLPGFKIPSLDLSVIQQLLPVALTIAFISFMESIAVAKAIQARHKDYQLDANQELVGLGLANIVGSFFQSFPTTGGFSRTAVNDQAGAKTGLAAIISAVLIGLTLLFFTPLFYFMPQAILASVILVAVVGLIDFKEARNLWFSDRRDFLMLIVTFLATLTLGIELGIAVGVLLSLSMVIYRSAYPHWASLGKVEGTQYYRNVRRFPEVIQREDVLVMRFDAPLFFANANFFEDQLGQLVQEKGPGLKMIVINAEAISHIDSTALHMLHNCIMDYRQKGIQIYIAAAIGPVRDALFKSGLIHEIGTNHLFMHVYDAVAHYDDQGSSELQHMAIQTNISSEQQLGNLWD